MGGKGSEKKKKKSNEGSGESNLRKRERKDSGWWQHGRLCARDKVYGRPTK